MKRVALAALLATTALAAHATLPTTHYMYMAVAPSVESPKIADPSGIYVYDIDAAHAWVETIPFALKPGTAPVLSIRGIMADHASNTLYVSYYGSTTVQTAGHLLAMDLKSGAEKWHMDFSPSLSPTTLRNSGVDRGCLARYGKYIYLPTGEAAAANASWWYVIDTATHTVIKQIPFSTPGKVAGAHDTICGKNGLVYMSSTASIGATNAYNALSLKIHNPADPTHPKYVGPFAHRIRPFTTTGSGSEVFVNEEDFVGFGHGIVASNTITEVPAGNGYVQPPVVNAAPSHGIAVTHDNKFVWITDANQKQTPVRHGVHLFQEVSVPTTFNYIGYLSTAPTPAGQTFPAPGWIMGTIDNTNAAGKQFLYAETGEVIDTTQNTVATLPNAIVG